jgi:hypothetical protein
VEDCLGGDDGFDKGASTCSRNIFPMPWDKLGGLLINKGLHISVLYASMSKRQSKVFYQEVGTLNLQALHNVIKIQVGTTGRDVNALVEVCDKPRDLTEAIQNVSRGNKVLFEWGNENRCIVSI